MREPVYPAIRYHKTLEPKKAKSAEHDVELRKLGYDRHAVIFAPAAQKEIKEEGGGDGLPAVPAKRRGRGQA